MNNYQDIINMKHYTSNKYPRMSMRNRAAQFSPFAALTGYDEAVNEVGRITKRRIFLSDDEKEVINEQINFLKTNLAKKLMVGITYFMDDRYKEGGDYHVINGYVKKIDEYNQMIVIKDKKILMGDIIQIVFLNEVENID